MNSADVEAAIERIMNRVDFYLHCELDADYEHDRPEQARLALEESVRQELLRANAIRLVSAMAGEEGSRDIA